MLCLIRGSAPCPSLLQSPFIFFHLATGSGFPKVPPLDLFLHIFQQPELPAQHSHCQAPSPAPRMFMCLGVDMPEQTFNSHFGMVSSRRAPAPLQLQCWGKELPSPTCSPSSAGSPDLFICAHSRCMEREAQEMPHRNSLTGHSPLQRHFGELQTHRKNQCQCSSSSRCRKQTPNDVFWVIPSQLECQLSPTAGSQHGWDQLHSSTFLHGIPVCVECEQLPAFPTNDLGFAALG